VRHPRLGLAVRAALAATAAWLIALQVPEVHEYAFYAPFGAAVTTYSAVAQSVSATVRTLAAIALGALLGIGVDAALGPGVAAIAVVVGVGTLLAGLPRLGDARSYVPVAGMFVLLLGAGDEVGYAMTYGGLFLVGAACAVAVSAVRPGLPLERTDQALALLRDACVQQLTALATALAAQDGDAADEATDGRGRLTETLAAARQRLDELHDATRGNRAARRQRSAVAARSDEFRALQRVAGLVDDLQSLSEDAPWGTTVRGLPDALRRPTSDALRALATTTAEPDPTARSRRAADGAVATLADALRSYEQRDDADAAVGLVVAAVVTTLRRSLAALTPESVAPLSTRPVPVTAPPGPERTPTAEQKAEQEAEQTPTAAPAADRPHQGEPHGTGPCGGTAPEPPRG
jgi:uncharacterized membrane protein YgaE (UPF0421/DUF939 family)